MNPVVGGELIDEMLMVTEAVQSTQKLQPSRGCQYKAHLCLGGVFKFMAWWLLVCTPMGYVFYVYGLEDCLRSHVQLIGNHEQLERHFPKALTRGTAIHAMLEEPDTFVQKRSRTMAN